MPYGSGYMPDSFRIGRNGGVLSQNRSEFGLATWHRFEDVAGAMSTSPAPDAVYRSMVTPPKKNAPFGRRAFVVSSIPSYTWVFVSDTVRRLSTCPSFEGFRL